MVALIAMQATAPSASAGEAYGTAGTLLYQVDLGTGAATLVGDMGDYFDSVAFGHDRQIYTIRNAHGRLYRIDPETAVATYIGLTGFSPIDASLVFDDDGVLWGTSRGSAQLHQMDAATGASTPVGTPWTPDIYALAWDGQSLYGVSPWYLYSIDRTTGIATQVGPLGLPASSYRGLSTNSLGELFEIQFRNLYSINKTTGAATFVLNSSIGLSSLAIDEFRDTDQDGMPDYWEDLYGFDDTDPSDAALDGDSDGLTNVEDYDAAADPTDADTDDDTLTDGDEVNTHGTDPTDPDTDADGLTDDAEVNTHGTDPLDADSDDDNLSDGDEVNTHGTNPLDPDSDADGMPDDWELASTLDPNVDDASLDLDSDGLTMSMACRTETKSTSTSPIH
jgi:hypothetical protein